MADNKPINISQCEGLFSLFGGTVLFFKALKKGSLFFGSLAAVLLYRGVSRHCHVYEFLEINTAEASNGSVTMQTGTQKKAGTKQKKKKDEITKASEDSFPASDPPAWTTGSE